MRIIKLLVPLPLAKNVFAWCVQKPPKGSPTKSTQKLNEAVVNVKVPTNDIAPRVRNASGIKRGAWFLKAKLCLQNIIISNLKV